MNYRLTIGLVVALAIVAAISAIIVLNDDPGTPDRVRVQREFLWTIDDDEIRTVSIRTGTSEQMWIKDDNRRWHFDTTDGAPVDPARWGGVTLLLSGPQHRRELAGAAAHLDRYGLVSPDTVIRVGVEEGAIALEVRLGDRTPDGISHYAQKDDDPGVFLIDATWGEALTKLVRELPHQTLWSTDIVVNALKVEHQGGAQTWLVDEEGTWRFDSTEGDPVDEERWESVLELLRSPRFRFETEDPPDSLEPYGLDAPVTVANLTFRGSEPIEIRLGGQTPDGVRQYAQINDAESVIMIETEWGAALANLVLDPPPTAAPAEEEDTDDTDSEGDSEGDDEDSDDHAETDGEDEDSNDSA